MRKLVVTCILLAACRKGNDSADGGTEAGTTQTTVALVDGGARASTGAPVLSGPVIAAIALDVPVYERANKLSRKLGVLRVGAVVQREETQAGTEGCQGGWYKVMPRGYVCANPDEASTDANHPIARAAAVRPDIRKPLPYAYGFVRAVAPQYLRIPDKGEQKAREFKLAEHLKSFKEHEDTWYKVIPGANDVDVPTRVPGKKSTELSLGELFGSREGDFDPVPFWLQGGRQIPNIAAFKVAPNALFASRVRRHTGLAFIGAFHGEAYDRRPFAITTDLRLIPITKVKPDTGSPWHGVELGDKLTLPLTFANQRCDKNKDDCTHTYKIDGDEAHRDKPLPFRSVYKLTGKGKTIGKARYREIEGGQWVKHSETGSAFAPSEWPHAATLGQKWIEVSIDNQTLVLWEGKTPVYATLVSTGQDGTKDPKTTKSTVQGTFRIRNKFVTATMDSNGKAGGVEGEVADGASKDKDKPSAAPSKADEKPAASSKADEKGEEGKTRRRGEGTFELRDVPYVQYFEGAYALHVSYWHDVFAMARSHGCVNLSPIDGQRIFMFTEPQIPEGWHGVYATDVNPGTTIVVHP
jgi:lipoprotein-anchoring transpeptidase ErfK/SrfK